MSDKENINNNDINIPHNILNENRGVKKVENGWVSYETPVDIDPGFSMRTPGNFQGNNDPGFSMNLPSQNFQAHSFEILINFFANKCQQTMSDRLIKISNITKKLSSICASEDSSISDSYSQIGDAANAMGNKLTEIYNDLANELKIYMDETISNESLTAKEIDEINSSLNNINNEMQSINWK